MAYYNQQESDTTKNHIGKMNMNNENLVIKLVEMLLKTSTKELDSHEKTCTPSKAGELIEVGKAYLFRTVTHIELGKVESIHGDFVRLVKASWVADTGRYHDCLKNGELNEVEPYPDYTVVNLSSLINFAPWNHELPTQQK